jgi:N-ethylmaleimide reductase
VASLDTADAAIANGHADAVAFGRVLIPNPDLPRRLQQDLPVTPYNRATFYGGDGIGYTDYPNYDQPARV